MVTISYLYYTEISKQMSKRKNKAFPATDELYDVAFRGLMNHLALPDPDSSQPTIDTWTRLGLDNNTQYTPLTTNLGTDTTPNSWLSVFPKQTNHATRTATLRLEKNTLKKNGLAIIRPLRTILKAKEKATPGFLTASDKLYFFIPDKNPKTTISLRDRSLVPELSIVDNKYLLHVVDALNPQTPNSNGLPEGVIFVELLRYIGTEAPTDESQFTRILLNGKFRSQSHFKTDHEKQVAWYAARYIGTTGEIGALSPYTHAVIL